MLIVCGSSLRPPFTCCYYKNIISRLEIILTHSLTHLHMHAGVHTLAPCEISERQRALISPGLSGCHLTHHAVPWW